MESTHKKYNRMYQLILKIHKVYVNTHKKISDTTIVVLFYIQNVYVQLKRFSFRRERALSVGPMRGFLVHNTCYITRIIRSIASPLVLESV